MDGVTTLQTDTLTGDIRDWLLGHLRDMQKPWAQMSEKEQKDKIWAAESAARDLVRGTVNIVSAHEFEKVHVKVGKFTVKEGDLKAEFTCGATDDNLIAIMHAGRAVLVLADPETFEGEREAAKPDADEPELPIAEDADEAA